MCVLELVHSNKIVSSVESRVSGNNNAFTQLQHPARMHLVHMRMQTHTGCLVGGCPLPTRLVVVSTLSLPRSSHRYCVPNNSIPTHWWVPVRETPDYHFLRQQQTPTTHRNIRIYDPMLAAYTIHSASTDEKLEEKWLSK